MITQAELKRHLHYDKKTGIFTRHLMVRGCKFGRPLGTINKNGYIQIWLMGRLYYAHRLAWLYVKGEWPPDDLDHRDTVRTHNWIGNLRPATKIQNGANTGPRESNTSGFKGVHRSPTIRERWIAQIRSGGKPKYLGSFYTREEASAAYVRAAAELHGEFARSTIDLIRAQAEARLSHRRAA